MKTKQFTILLVFTSLLIFSIVTRLFFNDFQNGWNAYIKKEYKIAYDLWLPLAKQGDSKAQFFVGFINDFGLGVPEDDKEALKWYELAAEQDDSRAQQAKIHIIEGQYSLAAYNLAKNNVSVALKMLKENAENGIMESQRYFGMMYAQGEGVTRDDVLAYKWYAISGLNGNKDAAAQISEVIKKFAMKQNNIDKANELVKDWQSKK
jgi:uncharacterized protein